MADEGFKRKLTAILSADVAGYSRMMRDDEDSTIRVLTNYRSAISNLIQKFRGHVVDATGDNLLAEFTSVVDAVNCAVEIQRELAERNAELPEDRKMEFRIGVNLGDVVEEEGRIYGDGINIAARMEGLAAAGGICISGSVYDSVESRLGLEYEFLGEQEVKNIDKPVRAYRVLSFPGAAAHRVVQAKASLKRRWGNFAIAAGSVVVVLAVIISGWQYYQHQADPSGPVSREEMKLPLPEKPSIAVLPFVNMSGDPEQEYLSDGFTEDIITSLAKLPRMFVIARESSFTYKDKSVKIQEIGRDLGVRYVLEGSIQKSGNRLRITAQLIDAMNGRHLWAEKYDRELKELFALQDEIRNKIVTELEVKLTEGEDARTWGTENFDAYIKVKQSVEYLRRFNYNDNMLARQKAKEALNLDPDYTGAMAMFAWTQLMDAFYGASKSPAKSIKNAIDLAHKVLDRDPSNAFAHYLLGFAYRMKGQFEIAVDELVKARELAPNSADINAGLGMILRAAGRPEEAIPVLKKAVRLSPFPPSMYLMQLGHCYRLTGQNEKAVEEYQKVLQSNPDNEFARLGLTVTCVRLGRMEDARSEANEVLRINPNFSMKKFSKGGPPMAKGYEQEFIRYAKDLRKAGLPE